jgi:O-antigen ligase
VVQILKTLLVVCFFAGLVFHFAKPLALQYIDEADYDRRRNVWFALTVVGFLSPSFWLFALVAAGLLFNAGRKDSNPVGLYLLLLHVIPPIAVNIPIVGINRLFSLDMYRILSLVVLLPVLWRLKATKTTPWVRNSILMDVLVLGFGVLLTSMYISPDTPDAATLHDSPTNVIRRGLLFVIDDFLVYYVFSRSCSDKRALVDAMASFCLATTIMALIAVFESQRHWLLYEFVGQSWGGDMAKQFLMRNGMVRSAVSAGHSLSLGYLFAVALGFWLYLRARLSSSLKRFAGLMLFAAGLLAAYSRGPWVGAVIIYFGYIALGSRPTLRLFKAVGASAVLIVALLLSPVGARIMDVVPALGGKVDDYNVQYRHRLAERSLDLIRENPWFGSSDAYVRLHDLRQAQGIIDFVNTYAQVTVFYGIVGLFFFLSFLLVGLIRSWWIARTLRRIDTDLAALGMALVACIIGSYLMLYTSSFVLAYEKLYFVLAGLASAYVRVGTVRMLSEKRSRKRSFWLIDRDAPQPANAWEPHLP